MSVKRGAKKGLGLSALKAVEAGRRSAEADLRVEAHNAKREGGAYLLPIAQISERPSADIRPVDEEHVASLVESIRALGLMQPICVDREHRLVAGAHRLAACRVLSEEDPERWGRVPVVVDLELDAAEDPERALRKEIAENEKRRNLTPAQVQAAAQRLMEHDPSFTRRAGRLKEGERALTPFLASTFGVSVRHVRSLLNSASEGSLTSEAQGDQPLEAPSAPLSAQGERAAPLLTPAERAAAEREEPERALKKKMRRQVSRWLKEEALSESPELKALLTATLKLLD